jgi:S-adenosylmethionine synthetase
MIQSFFTSESVSEGHPDKVCDQISDAILDSILAEDPDARVACETMATTGLVVIAGEVTTTANPSYEKIARATLDEIGYNNPELGISGADCEIIVKVDKQSPDISQGVTAGEGMFKEMGAGDQGMMFGFACTETPGLMPASLYYSHRILEELAKLRKSGGASFLRPDAKSQITVEYDGEKLKRIDTVVVSHQHNEEIDHKELSDFITEKVIKKVIPQNLLDSDTKYYINPTGKFVIGGPQGDCGLTGRKIIVDTYGGYGAHGGGAFSGKDPSKVDRSAAYAARYIAKNIVAAGITDKCLVQLAYAIGVAEPVSIFVDTYTGDAALNEKLSKLVPELFPVKPADIIKKLNLLKPIYKQTASYGHFGNDQFPWEKTDKSDEIKSLIS